MPKYIIIPARLNSQRLPRKLLKNDTGHPLIWHTVQNAKRSKVATSVIVATDSEEIMAAIKDEVEVVMTGECASGTQRVSSARRLLGMHGYIVNVQGDEPEVDMSCVDELFVSLERGWDVATIATEASSEEYNNHNVVKVVTGNNDQAMYFSRSPIPHGGPQNSLKHIGVYAYSSSFLARLHTLTPSNRAASENLEQLQWLENDCKIKVLVRDMTTTGIDTQEDYDRFVNAYTKTSG
jgi:3-deoxy-manno-octulosonate cytidylyltransferase (CMP-KDO synthetase)